VFYEKPFVKFERLLESYLATVPYGFASFKSAIPLWVKKKLFQKRELITALNKIERVANIHDKLLFTEHHQSHAASAFFPSPYNEAVVLTMDGVGEWATSSVAIGRDNQLNIIKEMHFPHSIGLLYAAFTYYLGFKVNSGEYKVMGLAPYGEPKYVDLILDNLIDLKEDGSFRLNLKYFDYVTGLTMTNHRFDKLFGKPARKSETELTQREMDIAASLQVVTEEIILRITHNLSAEYKIPNLCLAGGVALNCVANGKILKAGHFKNIWIQPAAGDAGGALGAALSAYYEHFKQPRHIIMPDSMQGAYLGPEYTTETIKHSLAKLGAKFNEVSEQELIQHTVNGLIAGKAIGWFQGRMEYGPRALGARSIIGDARSPQMQKILNLKIKYRESFRPFAPSVLREAVNEWFEQDVDSPYMLLVDQLQSNKRKPLSNEQQELFGIDKLNVLRSEIPAVTHVDYSARVQTVYKETNHRYWQLIDAFNKATGCPIIINTSFNVRGEPLVCTPEDAYKCFMGTELDMLVIGNIILEKSQQAVELNKHYAEEFALD
jgi:carbamoyltransferase